jgi:hypothetical protein
MSEPTFSYTSRLRVMFGVGMILGAFLCIGGIFSKESGIAAQVILLIFGSVCFFGCLFGMIKFRNDPYEIPRLTDENQKLIPSAPPISAYTKGDTASVYPETSLYDAKPVQYGE